MPADHEQQNSTATNAYFPQNNGLNEPSVNPFRSSGDSGNSSYAISQSPFANARSHDNTFQNQVNPAGASPFASSGASYQGQNANSPINAIPSPAAPETGTWSQDFDSFSRISQQSSIRGRRAVLEIYNDEQMQFYDRQKYTDLHYLLQTELKKDPGNTKALVGVALCNLALGEPQKAAAYFAKAIDIDETIRPSKFIHELPLAEPEDWLDMAEEMGHNGILDGSLELCSSIVESNQFADRVRRQAQKVREAIRQDYFAARDRILIGNTPKKKEKLGGSALGNALTFVICPLLLAILLGCISLYTMNISNGKTALSRAIYRLEHLKRGDTAVERMESCDQALSDAMGCFDTATRVNPFSKEAYFYKLQTANLMRELGRVRIDTAKQWDAEHWQAAKATHLDAETDYKDLSLSAEKEQAFQAEWRDFYQESKSETNPTI